MTKLTKNELEELKHHYVDRLVDNMSTKDLVQYVFDDLTEYVDKQFEQDFLDDCRNYWEDSFDDVIKEIKEYANCKFKKPLDEREATNFHINNNIIEED